VTGELESALDAVGTAPAPLDLTADAGTGPADLSGDIVGDVTGGVTETTTGIVGGTDAGWADIDADNAFGAGDTTDTGLTGALTGDGGLTGGLLGGADADTTTDGGGQVDVGDGIDD
jgi:hypothetical protein